MMFLNFFARAVVFHILFIPIITLLAGVVLMTLLRFKNASASLRAAISGATLIVILVLPWASMATPKIPVNLFPATPDANAESLNHHLSAPEVILPPPTVSDVSLASPQAMPSAVSAQTTPTAMPFRFRFNWYTVSAVLVLGLLSIWLLGVLWQLSVLMLGLIGIMRLRWSSHVVTENHLVEALHTARSRLDYRGAVTLLSSDKISFPITWGWLRSKIALPPDAVNWPAERIDAAILHELAHIKRRDFVIQTMSRFACAFQWYNPLVLRVFRIWKSEAEQACDDLVLRSGYSGERYSDILLEVWRSATIPRPQSSLGLAMVRTSTLEQRVVAILDEKKEREDISPQRRRQLLAIFGGTALLIATISLTRPTDYHLTPELQQAMDAIARQAQLQEDAHLALQIHLERNEEFWSHDKNHFLPPPQGTVADIALELTGEKARFRANYHPLVSRWTNGAAPYFIEQRIDISDGSQAQTILSDHGLNHSLRGSSDIGFLAGYQFRADDQVRVAIGMMEGKWQEPNLRFLFPTGFPPEASRGIEKSILNGTPVFRLQDIFTVGSNVQRRTWWFDPKRDYSLVQYEIAFFNSGSSIPTGLTLTTIQQLQKVAEGIWYPTQFTTQNLRYKDGILTDDSFRSTTTLSSLVVLSAIDSTIFQTTSVASNSSLPATAKPTAQEVFDGMVQKYARCPTFSCTGTYKQDIESLFGGSSRSDFSIRYARPSEIRVQWTKPTFGGFGTDTNTIYTESGKVFSKLSFLPTIEPNKSIEDAISGAAGVSSTISYLVPSLLMGKAGYLDHWDMERKPDDTVDGNDCYVVELETKGFGIYTLAIRKSDYALIRAISVFKSEVVDAQRARAHKENPAWFNDPGGPIKTKVSDTATMDFLNIVFDQPLSDGDFLLNAASGQVAAPARPTSITPSAGQNLQLHGKVVDAEGQPVAGAELGLITNGSQIHVTNGKFEINSTVTRDTSSASGEFDLPLYASDELIAVIDAKGYAVIHAEDLKETISLTPWTKVEGHAYLGTAPATGKQVRVGLAIPLDLGSGKAIAFLNSTAIVDADGAFTAEWVPDGIVSIYLDESPVGLSEEPIQQAYFETKIGQTAHVTIGGSGASVIGKVRLPTDPDLELNWTQVLSAYVDNSAPGLVIPAGTSREGELKLMSDYYLSDNGRKNLLTSHQYFFKIHQDGSFKIENVPPGSYFFNMSFVRKVMRGAVDFIGTANGTVEVPPGATTVNVPELRVQLRHPSSEASSKTGANALSVTSTPVYVGDIGVYVTSLGSVLPPNQPSATISDYKTPLSVPVTFTIPEDDVQTVVTKLDAKQKLKIEAYSRDMKSEIGTGSLVGVDNQIDMSTGMLTCKGMLTANGDTVLFPNMFLNIRLLLEIKHGVTLLPAKAIQHGNQGAFVYVIKPDKTVTIRNIEVGVIEGESAQIKKGLSSGETVVANVPAGLRDGSSVSDIREQEAGTKTNPR